MALATETDTSNLNFDDGKSNAELAQLVDETMRKMVNDPRSYGAYALSFTNLETVKEGLFKLADDGIKGNREDIERHLERGYTQKENVNVAKALIAKAEWTGLAGAVTNNLITVFDGDNFDTELTRVAMDITHTMTQSVLQMKKSPEKLPVINKNIGELKSVMGGGVEDAVAHEKLLQITEGLCSPKAVDHFVSRVHQLQEERGIDPSANNFGYGVLNGLEFGTSKLAYASELSFNKVLNSMVAGQEEPTVDISDLEFDNENDLALS